MSTSLLLLLILSLTALGPNLTAVRLTKLRQVKVGGKLFREDGPELPAIFLGREKLEVLDSGSREMKATVGTMTVCDVVPVPIQRSDTIYNYLMKSYVGRGGSQTKDTSIDKSACVSVASLLISRDKGIFDNLPFVWKNEGLDPRKQLYSFLSGGEGRVASIQSLVILPHLTIYFS